ncbi:MAG: hypothetical protein H8E72_08355 [Candidatus Marinimicrobia bacterium]|nr:hypothetical protein [Candidatus Neomarinimicrobiota bacterium]
MKIILMIALIWIFYQIKRIFSGIQISNNKKQKEESMSRKSGMDIQDADYEDVE